MLNRLVSRKTQVAPKVKITILRMAIGGGRQLGEAREKSERVNENPAGRGKVFHRFIGYPRNVKDGIWKVQ
jgi:hypothetical protein